MLPTPGRPVDLAVLPASVAQSFERLDVPRGAFFSAVSIFVEAADKPTAYDGVRICARTLANGVEAVATEILCWNAETPLRAAILADAIASEQERRRVTMLDITGMDDFRHPFVLTALSERALRNRFDEDNVVTGSMRVFRDVLFQDVRTLTRFGRPQKPRTGLSKGFSLGLF